MRRLIVLGVVLLLFCAAAPARADDLFPPSYRGAQLSYWAEWDLFNDGDFLGFFPDVNQENAVDDDNPATTFYQGLGTHGLGHTHLDFNLDGWAIAPGGGGFYNPTQPASFVANVANWVDWLPEKQLRVQVTYTDGGNGAPVLTGVFGIEVAAPNGSLPPGSLQVETPGIPMGGLNAMGFQGLYFYEDWIILPNPDWEAIEFDLPMGTIVNQIVIDTISVPEPAGLGWVGLVLLAVRKKRR